MCYTRGTRTAASVNRNAIGARCSPCKMQLGTRPRFLGKYIYIYISFSYVSISLRFPRNVLSRARGNGRRGERGTRRRSRGQFMSPCRCTRHSRRESRKCVKVCFIYIATTYTYTHPGGTAESRERWTMPNRSRKNEINYSGDFSGP